MLRKTLPALLVLSLACGKRGDPRPPIPVIPQATSDLVVTQRADQVILSWSYPSLTTAGRGLTEIRRISVLRYVEELPVSTVGRDARAIGPGDHDPTIPQALADFARVPTIAQAQFDKLSTRIDSIESANLGQATAGSRLLYADRPPRSADGRPVRVTYAVITEGASARSELSNLAILVPLAVAVPPAGLKAVANAGGVVLTWDAPARSVRGEEAPVVTGYRVYRMTPGAPLDEFATPINATPVTGTTYTDTPAYGEHEYRVAAVASEGPPLLQSAFSEPVRVTFKDLVAPPAPASLTALLETRVVRLLWDAVEAPDLAGYKLYRSEGMGHGSSIQDIGTIPIVNAPVTATNYVDLEPNLGIAYRYAVTSIDKSGNESPRVWTEWVVAPKTP